MIDMVDYQLIALAMLLGSVPFRALVELYRKRQGVDAPVQPIDAACVLAGVFDVLKVAVPVFLAAHRLESAQALAVTVAVCLIAVLSDIFPYWLMFKPQGRGLAAVLGVVVGLNPVAGLGTMVVWLAVLLLSDRLSVAAMIAGISAPVWLSVFKSPGSPAAYLWIGLVGCAYVIMAHSSSLGRLIDGTEPRWFRNKQ